MGKITCNDLLASQGLYDSGHIPLYQVSMPKLPPLQRSSRTMERNVKTAARAMLGVEGSAHEEMSVQGGPKSRLDHLADRGW